MFFFPTGVFGKYVWPEKPAIDENKCSCTCFDTVNRGKALNINV